MRIRLSVAVLCLSVLCFSVPSLAVEDFSAVHVTDVHVSPHLLRTGAPAKLVRGAETVGWIIAQLKQPQVPGADMPAAPAPSFTLATGDLTEFGVIDDTWSIYEKAFADLPGEMYVIPGNHDNTWVAMSQIMRRRHGGVNYSFDAHGIHFLCLNSATPQEPVPSIDATARTFLAADLASIAEGMPVIVSLHHPLYSGEFAPAEYDTLIDQLKDYNVVLMLYGHGHSVNHRNLDGIDGVMGGSTFGKNSGYGLLSVQGGVLRYAYHYRRDPRGKEAPGSGWRVVLEKPIATVKPERLFAFNWPRGFANITGDEMAIDLSFAIMRKSREAGKEVLELTVDGVEVAGQATPSVSSDAQHHRALVVPTAGLSAGSHLLVAQVTMPDGRTDKRALRFHVSREGVEVVWRKQWPAGVKAAPLLVGDMLIVADTAGVLSAVDRTSGSPRWTFRTGGEILAAPVRAGSLLVFGSGDGKVYAVDMQGRQRWTFDATLPVYGQPLVDGEVVYFGDNGGRLHALDWKTGKERWVFERADYAIESQPATWGDLVIFGAWDGYVYAVKRDTGELVWKELGPKASEGKGIRYYGPADCGPVLLGEKLFVCDRGYQVGTYAADGKLAAKIEGKISAITASADGKTLFARGLEDHVFAFGPAGDKRWQADVAAGRFPAPPTVVGERIYVCGNTGLLSMLDAANGKVLASYQTTPGFYVMAPVAVDDAGVCYVAGMDGSLTAVRLTAAPEHQTEPRP